MEVKSQGNCSYGEIESPPATPLDYTSDLEQYEYCKLPKNYTNEQMIKTLQIAEKVVSDENMAEVDSSKTINELIQDFTSSIFKNPEQSEENKENTLRLLKAFNLFKEQLDYKEHNRTADVQHYQHLVHFNNHLRCASDPNCRLGRQLGGQGHSRHLAEAQAEPAPAQEKKSTSLFQSLVQKVKNLLPFGRKKPEGEGLNKHLLNRKLKFDVKHGGYMQLLAGHFKKHQLQHKLVVVRRLDEPEVLSLFGGGSGGEFGGEFASQAEGQVAGETGTVKADPNFQSDSGINFYPNLVNPVNTSAEKTGGFTGALTGQTTAGGAEQDGEGGAGVVGDDLLTPAEQISQGLATNIASDVGTQQTSQVSTGQDAEESGAVKADFVDKDEPGVIVEGDEHGEGGGV